MKTKSGSLPEIICNDHNLYEGDLIEYFQTVFYHAQNLKYPYHNFRHIFHVVWLCYQACIFYIGTLTPREMRNLLIAALFHDFDHSGMIGNDDLNIERAVRGFKRYIMKEDQGHVEEIISLIRATEYPYKVSSESLTLLSQIIRDADMSQALSEAWIQQVIFGLASEWNKKPIEVLEMESIFHKNLKFHTEWALSMFSQEDIDKKIAEANELLELLKTKPII